MTEHPGNTEWPTAITAARYSDWSATHGEWWYSRVCVWSCRSFDEHSYWDDTAC